MTTSRTRRTPVVAAAGTVLLLAALLGCSTGSSDAPMSDSSMSDSSLSDGAGGEAAVSREQAAHDTVSDADAYGSTLATQDNPVESAGSAKAAAEVRERAVIASGAVGLRSEDVAEARDEVRALLDQLDGQLAEEESRTADDGTLRSVRMVLRVPSGSFDAAMTGLAEVADVVEQTRSTEDVTTQVIDTEVRIRAQRRSIARIETLLDRAETLGQVVRVESELTRRQADLDSLLGQQEWLGDQTSLATIHLTLSAHEPSKKSEDELDEAGFVAGVRAGWGALTDAAVATSTVLGALLPWAVLLAVLGVPLAALLRRRRPAPRAATAAPAAPAE